MSDGLSILASYVAPLIVRRFTIDPRLPEHPVGARFPAAVLFADISGFTALTERLAERGPRGAEELTVGNPPQAAALMIFKNSIR